MEISGSEFYPHLDQQSLINSSIQCERCLSRYVDIVYYHCPDCIPCKEIIPCVCGTSYKINHCFCPNCRKENPEGNRYLLHNATMVNCSECGCFVAKDANECKHCGKVLVSDVERLINAIGGLYLVYVAGCFGLALAVWRDTKEGFWDLFINYSVYPFTFFF